MLKLFKKKENNKAIGEMSVKELFEKVDGIVEY